MMQCPHAGCGEAMVVAPGGEVERMLLCPVCGEFYYRVGDVLCIRCCTPVDLVQADALLDAPHGQPLKESMREYLRTRRRRYGLPPLEDDDETESIS